MKRRGTRTRGRGVSEVISVLLMVSVTIILAAMVGSVLLNVVGDVEENPMAAASITFDDADDEIRVVYTATQENGTSIDAKVENSDGDELCTETIQEVGDSLRLTSSNCSGLADGNDYTVRIVAEAPDGKRAVVQEQDGSL